MCLFRGHFDITPKSHSVLYSHANLLDILLAAGFVYIEWVAVTLSSRRKQAINYRFTTGTEACGKTTKNGSLKNSGSQF